MSMQIYQDVELTLTECVIPPIVHVKQYDHHARKIRCKLYHDGKEYLIPDRIFLSYSGRRPDGKVFQYGSDLAPELIFLENNTVILTITDFMTFRFGSMHVDLALLNQDGDVLSSFSLILKVERGSISNGKVGVMLFDEALKAIAEGLYQCLVTEEGYFAICSDDGLGFIEGSESSTIKKLEQVIVNAGVTDDGHLSYNTNDVLSLIFSMDAIGEGILIVTYGNG